MQRSHEPPGVLFVDDEAQILRALERVFAEQPVRVHTARSVREALARLDQHPIEVIVTDQDLGEGSGTALLTRIRHDWPRIVRIMLTASDDPSTAVEAINQGEIYRMLLKPWNDDELRATVRQAVDSHAMQSEIERLSQVTREQNRALQKIARTLEQAVQSRTIELRVKHEELRRAYVDTVAALAEAVDAKDPYTRGHSERVGVYAALIAAELGCEPAFIERIYLAGLLHDIGKIGVPDNVLGKPGALTRSEYDVMRAHPEIGARILDRVGFLADIVPCVRHHHEWYDGSPSGYPERLSGSQIPYPSRIILVADTVDAMTSDRPYRGALPLHTVIDELTRFSGTQFDPAVADGCRTLLEREEESFFERPAKFELVEFLARLEDR